MLFASYTLNFETMYSNLMRMFWICHLRILCPPVQILSLPPECHSRSLFLSWKSGTALKVSTYKNLPHPWSLIFKKAPSLNQSTFSKHIRTLYHAPSPNHETSKPRRHPYPRPFCSPHFRLRRQNDPLPSFCRHHRMRDQPRRLRTRRCPLLRPHDAKLAR